MLKPSKKWVVGDRTFETYDEARSFAAEQRPQLQRRDFIGLIRDAISECPYGEANAESAEEIADKILASFTVKRKARK